MGQCSRSVQRMNEKCPISFKPKIKSRGTSIPADCLDCLFDRNPKRRTLRRFPPIRDDCDGRCERMNDEPDDERTNSALDDDSDTCLLQAIIFCCSFIVSNVEYLSYWSRKEMVHSNNYLIKIHISYSWKHLICELVQTIHCTSHHRLR